LKIKIYYDEVNYRLKSSKKALKLIVKVIRNEKKIPGDLLFILTTDERLILINREFLKHDYFTDVIAFNNSVGKTVNGEVYISIETVNKNANNYKVSLKEELLRVMIHGTLHLCGDDDKTDLDRGRMRKKEDQWLREKM
jgi:probable rRNA maturation factor